MKSKKTKEDKEYKFYVHTSEDSKLLDAYEHIIALQKVIIDNLTKKLMELSEDEN
jgi:dihydroxyacetone kinase-like predicted kinase